MSPDQAADDATQAVGDRFPALKDLEQQVEAAKLDRALAEARAATAKANQPALELPSLDVEIAQDTATVGDKSGLARPLVQMSSGRIADDIADLALDAARDASGNEPVKYAIRVVSNAGFLGDIEVYRILCARLENLRARLDPFTPPEPPKAPEEAEPAAEEALALPPALAVVGAGVQALGLVSKLLATSYHLAGEEVAVNELGFDILVAHRLQVKRADDEEINVELDRLMPARKSTVASDVWKLALDADQHLVAAVVEDSANLANARGQLTMSEEHLTALDAQILELTKNLKGTDATAVARERDKLAGNRKELADGLPGLREAVARAREPYEAKEELLKAIADFVIYGITPAVAGGSVPLAQAARGEGLVSPAPDGTPTLVLYCKLLAGGMDTTVKNRAIRSDRWIGLAGATAEFALLGQDGTLLSSGVRSAFQATSMQMGDPGSLKQETPLYFPLERRKR